MISVNEAFQKFRSRLELTQKEQDDASRRQKEIREVMAENFKREDDFLTGSYRRHTKTKPLKDVDIFYVLHDDERKKYRDGKQPSILLGDVEKVLAKRYGNDKVRCQRRSVSLEFPVSGEEERIMSFDVVPAFSKGGHYEIPDTATSKGWTETNPKVHAEKATAAHEAFGNEWKGMVRMLKRWNQEKGKPIKPSFLIEVMALDLLRPPFGGNYPLEFMSYFASAADRIDEIWPDPAGLGPAVSDSMDATSLAKAKTVLRQASDAVRAAINLGKGGMNGEALRAYRDLFGELFPLS
jgi:hypothetical protein